MNAPGRRASPPGFAPSKLLHFSPEIGYFLSPELLLSVQLRFQLISGANEYPLDGTRTECGDGVCSPGTYAFAGLARISYLFGEGDFRTYVTRHRWAGHHPPRRDVRVAAVCGTPWRQA